MRKSEICAAKQFELSRSAKHDLKILPWYFKDVEREKKCFELRLNDRNYQAGDIFLLRDHDNEAKHRERRLGKTAWIFRETK